MPSQMKLGVITIQNTDWPTILQRWQYIEQLGFDSVWLADHLVNHRQPHSPWLEAWTLLPALATATSTIRFGPLVTPFPLRNPAMLARQALTVDHISNGRLELGLGTGTSHDIGYSMLGIPDYTPAERVSHFREMVEIVDGMLRNEVTTYQGNHYQVNGLVTRPAPVQQPRIPITIAALGPAMLKITAQYADRWNTYVAGAASHEQAAEVVRQRNDMLNEYCSQIGRNPNEITRSYLVYGGASPFDAVGAFEDMVGSYREVGINEVICYYPPTEWYPQGNSAQNETFERI
ncbi:MAG: LLM class flavin-dependent oxidoreductase, partial [Chloroflexota bacterium]|nr:LLM class flavin-dependent oxidoreductase [Chloroflexota bacterium]